MSPPDLDARLAAMEARVPGDDAPVLSTGRRRARSAAPFALAPALVVVLAAMAAVGAVAGGAAVANLVQSAPGVQNPGQPLAGAALECMTPPEAAAYLAAHGFTDVVWQVETGDIVGRTETTTLRAAPPQHGYVVPGAILSDGRLHMIIDQRVGASGFDACADEPMP